MKTHKSVKQGSTSAVLILLLQVQTWAAELGIGHSRIGQAVTARVGTRVGMRTRAAAHGLADAEVLLRSCVGVGTRGLRNFGQAVPLRRNVVTSLLKLLREGRPLAQDRPLPVNDVDCNNQRHRDTDYIVLASGSVKKTVFRVSIQRMVDAYSR